MENLEELKDKNFDILSSVMNLSLNTNALLGTIVELQAKIIAQSTNRDLSEVNDEVDAIMKKQMEISTRLLIEAKEK
jgi:hypothetical protein